MIIVLINLFSFSLLTVTEVTYRPMSKKTIDFGEDVCYYEDIADGTGFVYVKPCQEGKRCKNLGISDYKIHTCVAYDNEYDNRNANCVTKDNYDSSGNGNGIDCTGYSCQNDKCAGTCSETQVKNLDDSNACVADPGFCYEYDSSGNPDKRYTPAPGKECVRFELQSSNQKTYTTKKLYSNRNIISYIFHYFPLCLTLGSSLLLKSNVPVRGKKNCEYANSSLVFIIAFNKEFCFLIFFFLL